MKNFVNAILLTCLVAMPLSFAHDGGHGPQLTDSAKQGGVVSPVIDAKQSGKGAHADVIYKAEIVRSEDGTIRVYFYDKEMHPLDLSKFAKSAHAVLEIEKKKKFIKAPFLIKQDDGAFVGKSPKPASKPFNIDIHVKEGNRDLMVAFDNLD